MDQRQKDKLESAKPLLADEINFNKIAHLLKLAKLVSKEKIEDITNSFDSNFARNLKLIDALQESEFAHAFDEFIDVLRMTNNDKAIEMISPTITDTKSKRDSSAYFNTLQKLSEKFCKGLGFRGAQYPIGIHSSCNSSIKIDNLSSISSNLDDPASSSPLKEKLQATLISGSAMAGNGTCKTTCDGNSFRLTRNNSGRHGLPMIDLSPVVPSSSSTREAGEDRLAKHLYTDKYSQTPMKSREHNFNQNRSISDNEEDNSIGSATTEPVVCWHPYAHERTQPQLSESEPHRASSPNHCCLPSYASSESDSSSDSVILDQNLIVDSSLTMALARDSVHMMQIQKATICHNSKTDYKMTARPRGPCLIVNNIDFVDEIFPTRKGSDEDSRRFDDIFQQLGFTVIMRRNQTADQMRKLFKEVAGECRPEHDALFVFVLSHGSEHGIYGTDGLEVYVDSEILPCFNNVNCKAMVDKPKVFIIQACRGMANDFGTDVDRLDSIGLPPGKASSTVRSESKKNRWQPSSQPSDGKKRKQHTQSDMLIVYPCLAGYVSVRNELRGSWLGVALAYFILLEAHNLEFEKILNLVTGDVMQRESANGHIQTLERRHIGWNKSLYFNPGIFL